VPHGFIKLEDVPKNTASIKLNKVFIPAAAWGVAKEEDDPVLGQPFVGEANSACSQTYLVIGYDPINHNFSKEQCENIASYISTKFFRYLVSLKKRTQNGPRHVYQFVPVQDFSKPWTDEKLYKKYKLTQDEITFIEKMIRPMVLPNE
jgi:site-specific DNA-methyltransferase (adenine-specific)